jgi:hypothetical protein
MKAALILKVKFPGSFGKEIGVAKMWEACLAAFRGHSLPICGQA